MKEEVTPMMKQFRDIKAQYPDAMLLFRCGDFYETYAEDAVKASKILSITLTHRSNGAGGTQATEMAGFPFHALDTYLPKLVRAGLRVAICDQLEDPKLTKKLVKRGVTELVTPGVSYSDTTLTQKENNWVACLHFEKHAIGVAFLDISTGEFLAGQGDSEYIDKLLTNFAPKEVLHLRGRKAELENLFGSKFFTFELEDWMLVESTAKERLQKLWGVSSLKGNEADQKHKLFACSRWSYVNGKPELGQYDGIVFFRYDNATRKMAFVAPPGFREENDLVTYSLPRTGRDIVVTYWKSGTPQPKVLKFNGTKFSF